MLTKTGASLKDKLDAVTGAVAKLNPFRRKGVQEMTGDDIAKILKDAPWIPAIRDNEAFEAYKRSVRASRARHKRLFNEDGTVKHTAMYDKAREYVRLRFAGETYARDGFLPNIMGSKGSESYDDLLEAVLRHRNTSAAIMANKNGYKINTIENPDMSHTVPVRGLKAINIGVPDKYLRAIRDKLRAGGMSPEDADKVSLDMLRGKREGLSDLGVHMSHGDSTDAYISLSHEAREADELSKGLNRGHLYNESGFGSRDGSLYTESGAAIKDPRKVGSHASPKPMLEDYDFVENSPFGRYAQEWRNLRLKTSGEPHILAEAAGIPIDNKRGYTGSQIRRMMNAEPNVSMVNPDNKFESTAANLATRVLIGTEAPKGFYRPKPKPGAVQSILDKILGSS